MEITLRKNKNRGFKQELRQNTGYSSRVQNYQRLDLMEPKAIHEQQLIYKVVMLCASQGYIHQVLKVDFRERKIKFNSYILGLY